MRTAFQGAVAQTLPLYDLILLLKVARDGACLTSSSRLFQSLGPRKDIALCPLLVFRKGIERSVSVFRSSLTFRVDLFLNKLERYSGTRPFSDLYTVVAVSPLIIISVETISPRVMSSQYGGRCQVQKRVPSTMEGYLAVRWGPS